MFGSLRVGRRVAPATLALACLLGGCTAEAPAAREEAIVGGILETGYPAVYFLYNESGGACTASLISPRVVLTARHCVANDAGFPASPAAFSVVVGSGVGRFTAEYRVSRVEVVPGSSGDINDGTASDVALLVLSAPARETPYDIARMTDGDDLVGVLSTSIGFGRTPGGAFGTKLRVQSEIIGYERGLIITDPTVCQGDSGGPLIGPDNLVYGVASFIFSPDRGSEPRCGTALGAYNEIARHIDWIDSVLASVGDFCVPTAEVCDGLDNDCNEVVDEGCIALGDPCESSDRCVGGLCADTSAGRVCTRRCDPLAPELGCGPGFYCGISGCDGYCVPGVLGATPVGADCAADLECTSGLCRDPGDGTRRCLDPCRLEDNDCLAREVCVPLVGECGGCVNAAIVGGLRGLGEPCTAATECRSGICHVRGGLGECAVACDGGACAEGYVCRDGVCATDRSQPVGGTCIDFSDCDTTLCASSSAGSFCTAFCSTDEMCPRGMTCDLESGVCGPERGIDGATCASADDCISGLCGAVGGSSVCLSYCDSDTHCGAGYECRRVASGGAVCVAAPRGGCNANPAGVRPQSSRGLGLLGIALGLLVASRRRRRS